MAPYISKYHIRSKIQGLHELGMSIPFPTPFAFVQTRCVFYGFYPSGKLYKAIGSTEKLSQSCGKLEVYD